MTKRITSIALVTLIVLSLCSTAFAFDSVKSEIAANEQTISQDTRIVSFVEAKIDTHIAEIREELGVKIVVDRVKTVLDFAGNKYKVVECSPVGYFIIHPESGILVEYALYAPSPYRSVEKGLYGGPTYYYVQSGKDYVHTVLENSWLDATYLEEAARYCDQVNVELLTTPNKAVVNYLTSENDSTISSLTRSGTDYWVFGAAFIRGLTTGGTFGYVPGGGTNGYCGYIAANIMLKYWHARGSITLPAPYSTTSSTALTNELIRIGAANFGYGNSTWALPIRNVTNRFCSNNGIPSGASWHTGIVGVYSEIRHGRRPVILFGRFPGASNHAVTAYGLNDYENPPYTTYIVHYGWNRAGYHQVHVVVGPDSTAIGSNTKYRP